MRHYTHLRCDPFRRPFIFSLSSLPCGSQPALFAGTNAMPAVPLRQVAVHLRPQDNVAVAAKHLPQGSEIEWDGATLVLDRRVGMGHKIALAPIREGEAVYKYGQIIGF